MQTIQLVGYVRFAEHSNIEVEVDALGDKVFSVFLVDMSMVHRTVQRMVRRGALVAVTGRVSEYVPEQQALGVIASYVRVIR